MSILNLGFQSIGLMRGKMGDAVEAALKNCSSIALLRKQVNHLKKKSILESTVALLTDVISHLKLKGKRFKVYESCSSEDIQDFGRYCN